MEAGWSFSGWAFDAGVFLVATNAPGVEHRLSQPIDPLLDVLQVAFGYPVAADPDLTAVAYVVWRTNGPRYLWRAPVVMGGPAAQVIGWIDPGMVVTQWPLMRPDGRAMLVAFGPNFTNLVVQEFSLDWTGGHVVANGIVGSYDAFGGDLIHVMNLVPNGFNFAGQGLVATRHGSAAPVPIGTPGMQPLTSSDVRNSTGTYVLGETEIGPSSGVYFRLANLSAPAMLLPLSATPIPAGTTLGMLRAAIVGGE